MNSRTLTHRQVVIGGTQQYEYRCAACGTPVGAKDDANAAEYHEILHGRRLKKEV
jgi:hypothetical protein